MILKTLMLSAALGLFMVFGSPAHAVERLQTGMVWDDVSTVQDPQQVVQILVDEAISVLSTQQLTKEKSEELFTVLFEKYFDVDGIAKFALGRYWRVATPAQRAEYTELFHGMIVAMYSERLREYSGEKFTIRNTKMLSDKDAVVSGTLISAKAAPAKVDWRLHARDGVWRIMDISVENVSMALTQRSEFASVIERCGGKVEALLTVLRSKAMAKK